MIDSMCFSFVSVTTHCVLFTMAGSYALSLVFWFQPSVSTEYNAKIMRSQFKFQLRDEIIKFIIIEANFYASQ